MTAIVIRLTYLVAAIFFIFCVKRMTHPRTAGSANALGAIGMFLAVLATLADQRILGFGLIFVGMAVGTTIGALIGQRVQMTAMPQMVALLNGFGGAASLLVAGAELTRNRLHTEDVALAMAVSGLVGAITFSGSMIAYGKLEEIDWFNRPLPLAGDQRVNVFLGIAILFLVFWMIQVSGGGLPYTLLVLVSLYLGVLLVMPIGGADMPVVVALLNSYSGIAAAATGFVIDNKVLIISGALIAASGFILTQIMCRGMNRSLGNVIFGKFTAATSEGADTIYENIRRSSAEDIALLLDCARRVVFVPGYGLAVAQAQHAVHDLAKALTARGVNVEYAIHPVAGRMPGHMNVLLAEADVPYEQLLEMDAINPTFGTVDVAIVLGANDVVNPVARTDPYSPIAGMPIIDVDKAATVVVIKRSLSPGFAGIPNPLFAAENTLMLFADGKQGVMEILAALKEL